jgi:hypothetical protein
MTKELFIEESGLLVTVEPLSPVLREAIDKSGNMVLKGVPARTIKVRREQRLVIQIVLI